MEVLNNQATELTGSVTIKIEKNDYESKVNERLKELRKKVNMRGFRPGHVPLPLVKKLYGKEILVEEVNKIVWDALINFIKENNLKLIGDFIPAEDKTKFNIDAEEEFEFAFDYGTTSKPFINYDELNVPYYKAEITDQDVDEEIKRIRKNFGQYIDSEEVKDDQDIFYVTLVELDENGQPKDNGLRKDEILLSLDLIDEKQREQFIGKKKDDEIIIKLSELIPDKKRRAAMINLKEEDLDNIGDDFKIIITKVKRFQEAELNEELYKKYAPTEEIKDEEQFRARVKENLEKYFEDGSRQIFKNEVKDTLMNTVEVKIPEDFLLRWLEYRQKDKPEDQRQSKEELEKQLPDLVKAVKWNTILEQIAEDLGIKLEREDAVKVHADMLRMSLANYGIDVSQLGEEFFMQHAENEYEKLSESDRYQIDSVAFENKVLEALQDKVKLQERLLSPELLEAKLRGEDKTQEVKQEEKADTREEKEQAQEGGENKTEEKKKTATRKRTTTRKTEDTEEDKEKKDTAKKSTTTKKSTSTTGETSAKKSTTTKKSTSTTGKTSAKKSTTTKKSTSATGKTSAKKSTTTKKSTSATGKTSAKKSTTTKKTTAKTSKKDDTTGKKDE